MNDIYVPRELPHTAEDADTEDGSKAADATLTLMHQIQNMLEVLKNRSSLNHDLVANLESIVPGSVIDNVDFYDVDIFSEQGRDIALEKFDNIYTDIKKEIDSD